MTPSLILVAVLTAAVLLAWARLLVWQSKAAPDQRAPGWRLGLLLLGQPLCAALLYLTLMPPPVRTAAGTLVVATRGAARLPATAGSHVVALPEASLPAAVERVPDLGTALRRYPGDARIHVVGEGLTPRDRDAAAGRALSFSPVAEPKGIVRLDPPQRAAPGTSFGVDGQVGGYAGGTVELVDPAGRVADRASLSGEGSFALRGAARAAGVALFRVRVRDAGRNVVEEAAVPLVTADETPPRILMLAGAPGPEPKFLRRWAADAGLSLHAQFPTGGGMAIGDVALPINGSTLGRFDLAILDERSWGSLGPGERAAMAGAVRGGLGLVLRVTGPLPDTTRRQWQALGFNVAGGADTATFRLEGAGGPLTRRALRVSGRDLLPLLRDAQGRPVAHWRAEGRGRIAVWPITDSFVLALAGSSARYAELWSDAFGVLARGREVALPRIDGVARATERSVICGLSAGAAADTPSGTTVRLLVEAPSSCAAFWAERPGWHQLRSGRASSPFYVHEREALPGLHAADARHATARLSSVASAANDRGGLRPGSSWPWFFAWLAVSAGLWWSERLRRAAPPNL